MDDKNKPKKKGVASRSKPQKKNHKIGISASRLRRDKPSSKIKIETIVVSLDSSGSPDEDYIEFLRTYAPRESSPDVGSSGKEEGSRITVETKERPRRISRKASGKTPE
jgi:hypothetical protein